jgi:hypothetical protein
MKKKFAGGKLQRAFGDRDDGLRARAAAAPG